MSAEVHGRRHRCFFGLCKATTGSLLIGGFEITLATYFVATAAILRERYSNKDSYGNALAIMYFVFGGCIFVVVALLFLGILTRRRSFLLVHLLKDIIFISAIVVITVLTVIAAANRGIGTFLVKPAENVHPENREVSDAMAAATGYIVFSLLLVISYGALQIWFFTIVLSAYKCIGHANRVRNATEPSETAAVLPSMTSWSGMNMLKYGCPPSSGPQPRPTTIGLSSVHLENCKYSKVSPRPTSI